MSFCWNWNDVIDTSKVSPLFNKSMAQNRSIFNSLGLQLPVKGRNRKCALK